MSVMEAAAYQNEFTFSHKIKPEVIFKEKGIVHKIHFLLCGSCFWSASQYNNIDYTITKCPSCNNNRVESMPISYNEVYKFDYDLKRGVTLEFSKKK